MTRRAVALGVVVCCVLATGLAAAGLPSVTVDPAADPGPVQSENRTLDAGGSSSSGSDNETYRMRGGDGEGNATQSMIAGLIAGASNALPGGLSDSDDGTDGAGGEDETSILTASEAVLGVVALVLVAAVATLRSVSGSTDETDDDVEVERDPDATAAAAAAGRGATAVAEAGGDESDLSNAVYRTWYEMTAALDVANPEPATPGEFADAAREAGLDPDAVGDLTAVFEAVRYGDEPAADYEERALAALREIERDADLDTGVGADRVGDSADSGAGVDGSAADVDGSDADSDAGADGGDDR